MVKKECRRCAQPCYSFYKKGIWICPHCGEDLTDEPVVPRSAATRYVLPIRTEDPDELSLN